jgi:nitrite reductase/ring-hydroxylating ferredoxin subunit
MTTPTNPRDTEPHNWHALPHAPAPGTLLGRRDALPDGIPQMQQLDSGGGADQPFRYLLLRSGEVVTAFVNRCAHFGVPLATRQDLLKFEPHISISCNVHYARYRWADGVCDRGDCEGESLLPIPVAVDATGHIHIAPVDTP